MAVESVPQQPAPLAAPQAPERPETCGMPSQRSCCLSAEPPQSGPPTGPAPQAAAADALPDVLDLESQGVPDADHGAEGSPKAGAPPQALRSFKHLLLVTAAHFLFNFGNSGAIAIPGCVWPDILNQAGAGEHTSSEILAASAVGNLVGVIVGGFAMDRLPAHMVACVAALFVAWNVATLPTEQSLEAVAFSNAVIYFGMGIVDCSYSVLIWAALESGVDRTGPFLVIKGLGSWLGYMTATLVATWTSTVVAVDGAAAPLEGGRGGHGAMGRGDYAVLAYTFCGLCACGGLAVGALPSPRVPRVRAPEQEAAQAMKPAPAGCPPPGLKAARCGAGGAWWEPLVILAGSLLLMLEMAVQIVAMTLLTESVPADTAHAVLIFFYCHSVVALLGSIGLAKRLPIARALALLFSVCTVGCAGLAVYFLSGRSSAGLLWVSYACLSAIAPTFSLTMSFIGSLATVSGKRGAALACGAALAPLTAAALAAASPAALWLGAMAVTALCGAGLWAFGGGDETPTDSAAPVAAASPAEPGLAQGPLA